MKILLGSNSPRRKELLQGLGYQFEVVTIDCDEKYPKNLPTEKVAPYLSELKAKHYTSLSANEILITADTIVTINNEILGKPKNEENAVSMLKKLAGKTHLVHTAFTLKTLEKTITKSDFAEVKVLPLTDEEITNYIKKYQPYDKAGSYGVQEWLGMAKIANINGSFYTIMGLPLHLLYEEIEKIVK